jgi:LPXTG-motif cell wall-anchored protein
MTIILERAKSTFPRGLGAVNQGYFANRQNYPQPIMAPMNYNPVQVSSATSTSAPVTSTTTSSTPGTGHRWRRFGGGQQGQQSSQASNYQQTSLQTSTAPTASDLAAFQQALSSALSLGLITSAQATAYQTQAASSTDAQLQALTAEINSLVSGSSSGAVSSLVASGTPTTSTSWWDGSSTIAGYTISNSTLTIGGVLILGLGYLLVSKKR